MKNWMTWIALLGVVFSTSVSAQDGAAYIAVGKAKTKKTVIALPNWIAPGTTGPVALNILDTIKNDLLFTDLFSVPDSKLYSDLSTQYQPELFKTTEWIPVGADFVLKAGATKTENGISVEAYLYQLPSGTNTLSKRYVSTLGDVKLLGHTLADDLIKSITGQNGVFRTKIAMVCDRTGKKEIYTMNFDGSDLKQLTKHRSITLSPAWSPDGEKIAYSLIAKNKKNIKNTNLYELDLKTNMIHLLSDRHGINSGANYSPDGKKIALTMSFLGNPEIFTLNTADHTVTRLTNHPGLDVDPNWSPDGKYLSFVSSRHGASMIYRMNADGSNVQRLTFAGSYNATPAWSPVGNKLAFAGWIDGHFDIFLMNPDGTNIERLTKNQGNNEDPAFSPDGNYIVFSSNRAGQKNIYAMNIEGTFIKRLTFGVGNCTSPRWSGTPSP